MTNSHALRAGAALAAALALAFALPLGSAAAGPAKTTAKPAAPAPTGSTLAEVEKASLQKRYDAVVAYAHANAKAADAEEAMKRAVDLAEELENWAKVVEHAGEFETAFGSSKEKAEVLLSKAGAFAHLEKKAEATAAYDACTKAAKLEVNGAQWVWNLFQAYGTYLTEADDAEGAKKVYEAARAFFEVDPNLAKQLERPIDSALKNLALIGNDPPAFPEDAKDMDGKPIVLADLKGKVVMLDFWATWCGPCRTELPNVVAVYKKWHAKGFEIVGVTLDDSGKEAAIKEFTKKLEMPWPQFFDGGGWGNAVAQIYGVGSIPHTILIGKDGKVVKFGVRGPAVEKAVEKLLK